MINHSLYPFDFHVFGQGVGIEGREERHQWSPLLVKYWMIGRYLVEIGVGVTG